MALGRRRDSGSSGIKKSARGIVVDGSGQLTDSVVATSEPDGRVVDEAAGAVGSNERSCVAKCFMMSTRDFDCEGERGESRGWLSVPMRGPAEVKPTSLAVKK